MRVSRALLVPVLLAGLLAGAATTARADDPGLGLTVASQWNRSAPLGAWTTYQVTVDNHRSDDFTGDVVLVPQKGTNGIPLAGYPNYRERVSVPHGGSRSISIPLAEAPAGYAAILEDAAGRQLANATPASSRGTGYAVGILTDQPQGGERIELLHPMTDATVSVTRFGGTRPFPTSSVFLAGLNAVVVDDFDVSVLSEAQQRALRDFVGFGGRLVAAGGARWRTTLQPLADRGLSPIRPTHTEEVDLHPLLDLLGVPGNQVAPVAVGDAASPNTVLAGPGGVTLAAEATVGAGRVLALAFDPLVEPIAGSATRADLLAWTFALDRSLTDVQVGAQGFGAPVPVAGGVNGGKPLLFGQVPGGPNPEEVLSFLRDIPAATAPPLGLLGLLLIVYIALTGPVNYVALRAIRRREVSWATVPALALAFTAVAYLAGLGLHGAAYQDNDLQVLRPGSDGAFQVAEYHGIFTPRRGDFAVDLGPTTIASTTVSPFGGFTGGERSWIAAGGRERVNFVGSALGSVRTLQTLSVARAPAPMAAGLEAHLSLVGGRVTGTVANTGDRDLRNLVAVSSAGQVSILAPSLVTAHSTITVAGELSRPPIGNQPLNPVSGTGAGFRQDLAARIGQEVAQDGRYDGWTLVGVTGAASTLAVAGSGTQHAGLAVFLLPFAMEAADALPPAGGARLVISDNLQSGYRSAVWDLGIPAGYRGPVKLSYASGGNGAPVRTVEVYDWGRGSWRSLPIAGGATSRTVAVELAPGELARGVVRTRTAALSEPVGLRPSLSAS